MPIKPTREQAWEIFCKYNDDDALIKHALSVEGVMRHFAEIFKEDKEKWGVVGLLHDIDYQKYPEQHCKKAREIMEENEIDEEYIRAVISHGYGICSDVEPRENMEKVLYTIDELTGLITAVAIMRPSKSVMDLEYKSVNKKYKTKSFAAGVNRDIIEKGTKMLEMDIKYIIEETILGMRKVADSIGLNNMNF